MALVRLGIDERSHIVGAAGKRPVLRNLTRKAIEHFRRTVEVVDLVGQDDVSHILEAARGCAAGNPSAAPVFAEATVMAPSQG